MTAIKVSLSKSRIKTSFTLRYDKKCRRTLPTFTSVFKLSESFLVAIPTSLFCINGNWIRKIKKIQSNNKTPMSLNVKESNLFKNRLLNRCKTIINFRKNYRHKLHCYSLSINDQGIFQLENSCESPLKLQYYGIC